MYILAFDRPQCLCRPLWRGRPPLAAMDAGSSDDDYTVKVLTPKAKAARQGESGAEPSLTGFSPLPARDPPEPSGSWREAKAGNYYEDDDSREGLTQVGLKELLKQRTQELAERTKELQTVRAELEGLKRKRNVHRRLSQSAIDSWRNRTGPRAPLASAVLEPGPAGDAVATESPTQGSGADEKPAVGASKGKAKAKAKASRKRPAASLGDTEGEPPAAKKKVDEGQSPEKLEEGASPAAKQELEEGASPAAKPSEASGAAEGLEEEASANPAEEEASQAQTSMHAHFAKRLREGATLRECHTEWRELSGIVELSIHPDWMRNGHQYWLKYGRKETGLKSEAALKRWKTFGANEQAAWHGKASRHNAVLIAMRMDATSGYNMKDVLDTMPRTTAKLQARFQELEAQAAISL